VAPVVGSWGTSAEAQAPLSPMDTQDPVVPAWGSIGLDGDSTSFAGPVARDMPAVGGKSYAEDDDEDDERPSHPYTWLQLIVLALVAFVLGFLIVMLASRSGSESTPATTPGAAAAMQVATSTPPVV
jgi:hypothetical protein